MKAAREEPKRFVVRR